MSPYIVLKLCLGTNTKSIRMATVHFFYLSFETIVKRGFYNTCIITIIPDLNLKLLSYFGISRLYEAQANVFICGWTKRTAGNLTNHLVSFKNKIAMAGDAAVYHLQANQFPCNGYW